MSNEDQVDSLLDKMEGQNSPQSMSAGLQILYKLIHNIISNPLDPKYRNIKTSNNTIKSKIMALKGIEAVLLQLGYVLEGDTYVLKDESIGDFLEGAPAIDYRRRLTAARLDSQQAYEKELNVIKEHKVQQRERQLKQKQAQRLRDQCKNDAGERKYMKADTTKSNNLKFGGKTATWKDIGVDLCKKGG